MLGETNFSGANLTNVQLSGTDLTGANLSGADLSGAKLYKANLRDANLRQANLTRAELNRTQFSETDLTEANLSEAILDRTEFVDLVLDDAVFWGAYCYASIFSSVDLSNARGLAEVDHRGPSTIGIDTIYRSSGKIPELSCAVQASPTHSFLISIRLSANRFSSIRALSAIPAGIRSLRNGFMLIFKWQVCAAGSRQKTLRLAITLGK